MICLGEGGDGLVQVRGEGVRLVFGGVNTWGRGGVGLQIIYLAGVLIGILQVSGAGLVKV